MKGTLCTAMLVVLLALGALPAAATGMPSLQLRDRAPLTVKGANFKARELVRVTASVADETVTRSVRARANGDFTVRYLTLSAGRCEDLAVVARGATGTRAVLKLFPPAACLPVAQPTRTDPPVATASQAPRVRVADSAPLVVRGSNFRQYEVVRVVYRAQSTWRRTATATAAGTFTVRFPVSLRLCPPSSLTATGSKGSQATYKPPPPMCPQPPDEP
jgi:hypothetical protein